MPTSTPPPIETDCRTVHSKLHKAANFLLLDCREQDEYVAAGIEGSIHVPMSELAARVHELEPYRAYEIAVHCHHGGRSLQVANWPSGKVTSKRKAWRAASMSGRRRSIPWSPAIEPVHAYG